MSFTTYITTWNKDPLSQIQDMINKEESAGEIFMPM